MNENDKKEELEMNNEEIKQEEKVEKQEVTQVAKEEPAKIEEVKKEEPKVENKETTKEPEKDKKGLAIASMVLGIIALVMFCIWYIAAPCAILALIFGILSIKSSKRGMAIAGVSTGAVGLILMIILYVFVIALGAGIFNGLKDEFDDYRYHNDYYYDYNSYDNNEWF